MTVCCNLATSQESLMLYKRFYQSEDDLPGIIQKEGPIRIIKSYYINILIYDDILEFMI